MNVAFPISLRFAGHAPVHVRARISYAFRVFAAVYGHPVVDDSTSEAAVCCLYGKSPRQNGSSGVFYIPELYCELSSEKPKRKITKHRYANESFHLAFGIDALNGKPDWLGEIFQWLSSSYERGITARDGVGRIPYSEMVFSSEGISPRKPHAALLMAWMENELVHGIGKEALSKAPCPFPGVEHAVVSSHDIDFYSVDRISTFLRLAKNLVIAISLYRDWSYFSDNAKMMLRALGGKRVGDYLPPLLTASEDIGFRSTFFAVSRHGHRRDPHYRLDQIAAHLSSASNRGFSVGIHASYRSVTEDRTLAAEAQELAECGGRKPLANRQHWLRFQKHEDLFGEVERAELLCDSTLGFPDRVGFRNGACFAFPPYDFVNERPHRFLEIPLVIMDGSLEAASRNLGEDPQQMAEEVLRESRDLGWGGISVLWHNPMESLSVPSQINRVFWNCAKQQRKFREQWMSSDQFLAGSLPRFQAAGLLEGVRIDG